MPTFIRGGELLQFAPCSGDRVGELPVRCSRVLVSRQELVRAFRRVAWPGSEFFIEEVLWLTANRFAGVVRTAGQGSRGDVVVIVNGRRLVFPPAVAGGAIFELRVSPRGGFVAARSSRGAVMLTRQGRFAPLPLGAEVVAWSPGEERIAVVRGGEIAFFELDGTTAAGVRLPIAAADLVWR
ncbi:MAG: hypothetical protein ACRDON_05520 [Gaiellaceae bacterium]